MRSLGSSGSGHGDNLAAGAGDVTGQIDIGRFTAGFDARFDVWPPDIQPGHRLHANHSAMSLV